MFLWTGKTKGTILVVEDDPQLRTFYRSALMIYDYKVSTAADGVEAFIASSPTRPISSCWTSVCRV